MVSRRVSLDRVAWWAVMASVSWLVVSENSATAQLKLSALFSDHMVLQRGRPVPVWGTARAGAEVRVRLGKQDHKVRAGRDGQFRVMLSPLAAGGPLTLKVESGESLEIEDVLIGDVWLASGQSNMAMTVKRCRNAKVEAAAARYPRIRMFTVRKTAQLQPAVDVAGAWRVCQPTTVGGFSATAYFFGRRLHQELDVPIGLINSSWGGTAIEAWTSIDVQAADSRLKPVLKPWKNKPKPDRNKPANLFNGMIAPLVGYGIRGGIWYQGERNARTVASARLYRHQLPLLIGDWRKRWGQTGQMGSESFPFFWVQLPNFKTRREDPNLVTSWAVMRESMQQALRVDDTGMAVTIAVGEARDIHPKDKQSVGDRLAQAALAVAYKQKIVAMGPLMRSVTIEDSRVRVQFDHVGGGIRVTGTDPAVLGFALAGPDRVYHKAKASIDGSTVVVESARVPDPIAVRYAFGDNPAVNLVNSAGIPAAPFRSDNWDPKPTR